MVTITTALAKILQKIQRPGDFYASGVTEIFTPSLAVTGIGPIALPLLPVQAEQLIAVAEQAPYGRGEETLVDTQVRRTWQIEAARVELGGRHWQSALDRIVKQAVTGLGVSQPVTAELYKLLVYDAGSFFVSHRDTEKAPGMFALSLIHISATRCSLMMAYCSMPRSRPSYCLSPVPSTDAYTYFVVAT